MTQTDLAEWVERYRALSGRADACRDAILARAQRVASEAGLDPALVGIQVHNALTARHYGAPWRGIDYAAVERCSILLNRSLVPHRLVHAWAERTMPSSRQTRADHLCRRIVGCTLDELVGKWVAHGYRPTIRPDQGGTYAELADAYDRRAAERGLAVTCYRS